MKVTRSKDFLKAKKVCFFSLCRFNNKRVQKQSNYVGSKIEFQLNQDFVIKALICCFRRQLNWNQINFSWNILITFVFDVLLNHFFFTSFLGGYSTYRNHHSNSKWSEVLLQSCIKFNPIKILQLWSYHRELLRLLTTL